MAIRPQLMASPPQASLRLDTTPFSARDYDDGQCSYDGDNGSRFQLNIWRDTDLSDMRKRNANHGYINNPRLINRVNEVYVSHFSLPFFYWKSPSPELSTADYRYGENRLSRPIPAPDITGYIVVQKFGDEQSSNWRNIHFGTQQIVEFLEEREGNSSLLFKMVVPFSTRTAKETLKSFFPLFLRGKTYIMDYVPHPLSQLIALIGDIVTIPFKFLSFIPRAIYQHKYQNNRDIGGLGDILIVVNTGNVDDFNWNQGVMRLDVVHEVQGEHNRDEIIIKRHAGFIFGA